MLSSLTTAVVPEILPGSNVSLLPPPASGKAKTKAKGAPPVLGKKPAPLLPAHLVPVKQPSVHRYQAPPIPIVPVRMDENDDEGFQDVADFVEDKTPGAFIPEGLGVIVRVMDGKATIEEA